MTAPPKGSDSNNISSTSKQSPLPKIGTSRKSIPAPTGDFALPPPLPVYYDEGGLRKVQPYMFTFHSWAKERWQGRTLIDIYSEFRFAQSLLYHAVHLQYLGHPIANDPLYQNSAAWGESRGKGGVYSSIESIALAEESRRCRGQAFMESEKSKERGGEGERESRGEGEEGIDRKKHNLTLTEGAERAIKALRGKRDEVDGYARDRDVEGLEMARKRFEENGELMQKGQDGEGEEEEGFCKKCFTPLLPDPKPEQLFIWLHAMRYTTEEWDWKSELPYWAEASYEVPLSSILT